MRQYEQTWRTKATLQGVLGMECRLYAMHQRVVREAFNRGDTQALAANRKLQAR